MTRNDSSKSTDKATSKAADKVDSKVESHVDDTVARKAEPTAEPAIADQDAVDAGQNNTGGGQDLGYEVNQQLDPLHVQPAPISEDPAELANPPGRRDG